MGLTKLLRTLYIRSTDFTHGYQGKDKKLRGFYRFWSYGYDFSVKLDPAFGREMRVMIESTVKPGDVTLDIGCGTGISTLQASAIAAEVVGIDLSAAMVRKLEQKIRQRQLMKIRVITGRFPEELPEGLRFDSIISSFAIVHFPPEERKSVYQQIYNLLRGGGRLGLFAAQGEIASSFETQAELSANLEAAGFSKIEITNVAEIYRSARAEKQ